MALSHAERVAVLAQLAQAAATIRAAASPQQAAGPSLLPATASALEAVISLLTELIG